MFSNANSLTDILSKGKEFTWNNGRLRNRSIDSSKFRNTFGLHQMLSTWMDRKSFGGNLAMKIDVKKTFNTLELNVWFFC